MKNKLTNHIKNKIGKWQVIYSEEKKFIWFKNAKTAGTSMYRGIMINEIYDLVGYKENPEEFLLWWDSLTDEKLDDYFKFTFVRNPFDRLVSAFNHIVMENLLKLHMGQERELNYVQLYMLFNLFVQRGLQTYDINKDSVHWMTQYGHVAMDGYQYVDFVGKYENLESDWRHVAKKIGVSEELPYIGASSTAKESSETREVYQNLHYSKFYRNQEIIDIVSKFYKKDIDIFGYKLEI